MHGYHTRQLVALTSFIYGSQLHLGDPFEATAVDAAYLIKRNKARSLEADDSMPAEVVRIDEVTKPPVIVAPPVDDEPDTFDAKDAEPEEGENADTFDAQAADPEDEKRAQEVEAKHHEEEKVETPTTAPASTRPRLPSTRRSNT